jgi:ketosteroid isomerase-like protein
MDAKAAVERFFTAYYTGDVDAARDAITDDFSLYGPFATCRNPEEFFGAAPKPRVTRRAPHVSRRAARAAGRP